MSTTAPNIGLTYLSETQTGAEVLVNELINFADSIMNCGVENLTTTADPGSPTDGQCWFVNPGPATGLWTGHDNQIASWYDGWHFFTPRDGFLLWDKSTARFYRWKLSSTSWLGGIIGTQVVSLGTNATGGSTTEVNPALGNVFNLLIGANVNVHLQDGSFDGQALQIRITQDGTGSRVPTITGNTIYSTTFTSPLSWSTNANYIDVASFEWVAAKSKWTPVRFVKGLH